MTPKIETAAMNMIVLPDSDASATVARWGEDRIIARFPVEHGNAAADETLRTAVKLYRKFIDGRMASEGVAYLLVASTRNENVFMELSAEQFEEADRLYDSEIVIRFQDDDVTHRRPDGTFR